MARWDCRVHKYRNDEKINKFISEIIEVCKKHGLSISHEDVHGAFEVTNYDKDYDKWLEAAHISREFKDITEGERNPIKIEKAKQPKQTKDDNR